MPRQILFRGKRVDNGEWVEGFYAELADGTPIIQRDTTGEFYSYEVVPETVGQWTELYDKNKARIWEGDVFRFDGGGKMEVKVEHTGCGCHEGYGWYVSPEEAEIGEVIGNIHDTPSLLNDKT